MKKNNKKVSNSQKNNTKPSLNFVPVVLDEKNVKLQKFVVKTDIVEEYLDRKNYLIQSRNFQLLKESDKRFKNSLINREEFNELLLNPNVEEFFGDKEKKEFANLQVDPNYKFKTYDELLSEHRNKLETRKNLIDQKIFNANLRSKGMLSNCILSSTVIDQEMIEEFKLKNVRKILLLTDTAYYQKTKTYKKILKSLTNHGFEFVEFTNIQPDLNKRLVFEIYDFAKLHGVDTVLAFGSWSTIDISKFVIVKLTRPSLKKFDTRIINLYSNSKYLLFSFPTIVCLDEKVNSRSIFINSDRPEKLNYKNYYKDSISLLTPIDNSDCSFFYPNLLLDVNKDKLIQILFESFYRSILNFFDKSISAETEELIVNDIKIFESYARLVKEGYKLDENDADLIMRSIIRTVDGTTYINDYKEWGWFALECGLSGDVNSKKIDGLALFAPLFIQEESKYKPWYKERATLLGNKLYNCLTVEGFILELTLINEEFNFPLNLLDVREIKHVNPKELVSMSKRGSYLINSNPTAIRVLKKLPVW